jgi:hypothetical protein
MNQLYVRRLLVSLSPIAAQLIDGKHCCLVLFDWCQIIPTLIRRGFEPRRCRHRRCPRRHALLLELDYRLGQLVNISLPRCSSCRSTNAISRGVNKETY